MVFIKSTHITENDFVSDIVNRDYRTADVFLKYGIDFCCGGKRPLQEACDILGIDLQQVKIDLEKSIRDVKIPNTLVYQDWDIDFLTAYLVNVHHQYLKNTLPATRLFVDEFIKGHLKQFSYLQQLQDTYYQLYDLILPLIKQEEEVIFPYIRQMAHAYHGQEPYALLLIRTLRKPVEETLFKGHRIVTDILISLRTITSNYLPPQNSCTRHKVALAKIKEIDNDLTQHLYLEQSFLYPKAISIEKELLGQSQNGKSGYNEIVI